MKETRRRRGQEHEQEQREAFSVSVLLVPFNHTVRYKIGNPVRSMDYRYRRKSQWPWNDLEWQKMMVTTTEQKNGEKAKKRTITRTRRIRTRKEGDKPMRSGRRPVNSHWHHRLDSQAVFHLSKPVADSNLKPVSVCMCKCCGRFGYGAVALATRVTTFTFPLNMSTKNVDALQSCA